MTFQERGSIVAGAAVWRRVADGRPVEVLPDGCMDLIWDGAALVVAGPDTRAHVSVFAPGTVLTGLRFAPGAAPRALGVPAQALRDERTLLGELWPRRGVREVEDRLADARSPGRVLELVARDRLRDAPPDPSTWEIVRRLAGGEPVRHVAESIGLSERQLHRRSLAAFGYGPKVLARILRLRRALALVAEGRSLAASAADAGYADQAHFARDARVLGGGSPTQLAG